MRRLSVGSLSLRHHDEGRVSILRASAREAKSVGRSGVGFLKTGPTVQAGMRRRRGRKRRRLMSERAVVEGQSWVSGMVMARSHHSLGGVRGWRSTKARMRT